MGRVSITKGWAWSDNSALAFLNWDSSYSFELSSAKRCAYIDVGMEGKWQAQECVDAKYNYICEKHLYTPPIQTTTKNIPTQPGQILGCKSGWTSYQNSCYKYYNSVSDLKTFDEAKEACQVGGGSLVEIFSEIDNNFVTSLIRPATKRMNSMLGANEKDCPTGWIKAKVGSEFTCYKQINSLQKSWYDAQSVCRSQGGDLATIKSYEENAYLANFGKLSINCQ